jgi:hypothetical protein
VFDDATQRRVWLVVGYSGENDPVFSQLAKIPQFDFKLYWAGYKDNGPAPHLQDGVLTEGKYAFYVPGHDADDFLVTLAQGVNCFPPEFVRKPFSHLISTLDVLTPYAVPDQDSSIDVMASSRSMIQHAIAEYEKPAWSTWFLFMTGHYDKVIALSKRETATPSELKPIVSWAHVMQAFKLTTKARGIRGGEADQLYATAYAELEAALKVTPSFFQAFHNWGNALSEQATH